MAPSPLVSASVITATIRPVYDPTTFSSEHSGKITKTELARAEPHQETATALGLIQRESRVENIRGQRNLPPK